MSAQNPQIYNIPAGLSFVDSLAKGLLERVDFDPLKLSEYLILLPSRRACRSLREAFLRLSSGKPLLLPKMQPLGEIDADELSILLMAHQTSDEDIVDIPPAISTLRRDILLARLVLKLHDQLMPTGRPGFDQAISLAQELGQFLDQVQTEGLSFDKLSDLVPEDFSEHWQVTLDFLKIVTEYWPHVLAEQGVVDPATRRNLLLQAQTSLWSKTPATHPVIVAGVTGSVPAMADLMQAISRMPLGEVIIPGLDQNMDTESWEYICEDHPQFYIKQFLEQVNVTREGVSLWSNTLPENSARPKLMSEVMRPVETTEKWQNLSIENIGESAVESLTRVDCTTAQEEADVIALMMREVLEEETKTAALITPDRKLARRVAMALRRWDIMVDDSGGERLSETPIGCFLILSAKMVIEDLTPIPLLSCLKHPMVACGQNWAAFQESVGVLEKTLLRGARPNSGIEGLKFSLSLTLTEISTRSPDRAQKLSDIIMPVLNDVGVCIEGFTDLLKTEKTPFAELLSTHIKMVEALAKTDEKTGAERLWCREDGEASTKFLNDLYQFADDIPDLGGAEYLELLSSLMTGRMVRPRYGQHPRLSILGQLEARLYNADLVILGGMNEKAWPADITGDPWMSRQMRQQFGLPAPERQISISAHDFVQAVTSPNVVMTRAARVDGAPTVASRWLLRLDTVLQSLGLALSEIKPQAYKDWAMLIDRPANDVPMLCERPAPTPPVSSRPRTLSVTRIETWMRDPYEIYASTILKLRALDPIDDDPSAAMRGTVVHNVLEKFIEKYPKGNLPETALDELLAMGKELFIDAAIPLEVQAFWWPRFEKSARGFIMAEQDRRETGTIVLATEVVGSMQFSSSAGKFTLTAKADRIDKFADGTLDIIDYKTGQAPKAKDVLLGYSPQLPLEALIVKSGGFQGIVSATVSHLAFWIVSGGKTPFEIVNPYASKSKSDPIDIKTQIDLAQDGLQSLIEIYDRAETAYPARPLMDKAPRYSDYEHFARIKEWGAL